MLSRRRPRQKRASAVVSPFFALTFASIALFEQGASAHDRKVAVTLEGGTCVAQSALRDAIALRGGRITDEAPVRLRVRVRLHDDGQVGVEIGGESARGALADRRFVAPSCADAVDAIGLVIALAGDETERAAPPPVDEAPAAPAPALPPPVSTPTSIDTPVEARDARAAASETRTPSRFALGAGALGTTFGEGQVGARVGAAIEWRRSLLPWVEASASMNVPRTLHGGGGGADAAWISGRLAAALPFGTYVGRGLRMSVFGGADIGALNVSGSGATRVDSRTRPWFALAGGARARWDIKGGFFAGLDGAAVVPLVRDDFVFVNGGTAYRVPVVGAETAVFLGAHFR